MRWSRAAVLVVSAAVLACAGQTLLVAGSGSGSIALQHWLQATGLLAGAGLCLTRGLRHREESPAWLALGAALVLQVAGWAVYWLWVQTRNPIPYPSAADGLWLTGYAVNYVALALLVRARLTRHSAGIWLDALVGALALGALSAAVLFHPVLSATGGSTAAVVTNLGYPLGDLLSLGLVVVIFAISGWRPGRSIGLLGAAFLLSAVIDSIYLYRSAAGTYESGTLIDVGWTLVAALTGVAAWVQPRRHDPPEGSDWREFLVPGAFAVLALAVLIFGSLRPVPLTATLLAVGTMAAVATRGAVSFREGQRLAQRHRIAVGASLTDSLTGLRNHRAFHERLAATAGEPPQPRVLVMLDLVALKYTNDTHGHQAGDERLRVFARALTGLLRRGDDAFRIGGDEFAVLLQGASAWDGFGFAERLQASVPDAPGVPPPAVSTGLAGMDPGAGKDEVIRRADLALIEAKRSSRRAVIYSGALEHEVATADHETDEHHNRALATSLARAVDAKDSYTRSHCETVAETCILIAERLELAPERVVKLRLAGLLHDVGKIGIPDAILQKPGPLDDDEFAVMKSHARLGYEIVSAAGLEQQAEWILRHHERPDGRGYPDGLAGDDVPLESRIVLVADAFEAMTSDRPYRRGRPIAAALEELRRCSGTQFDPRCVAALEAAVGQARRDPALSAV